MTTIIKPKIDDVIDPSEEAQRHDEVHSDFVVSGYTGSDGGGLTLTIAAGKAHIAGYRVEDTASQDQTLTDNATNHVFLDKDGAITINTTGVAPADSIKLMEVVTSAGAISSITDTRPLDPHQSTEVLISGAGSGRTRLSDWRHASDVSKIDHADIYQPYAEDVWIKKGTPALRQQGTETGGLDYRIVEDAGKWKLQRNTGTETAPVWNTVVQINLATGNVEDLGYFATGKVEFSNIAWNQLETAWGAYYMVAQVKDANTGTFLLVVPKGNPTSGILGTLDIFRTDYLADQSNFELLRIATYKDHATFGNDFIIRAEAGGTGSFRNVSFWARRQDTAEWQKILSMVTTSGEDCYVDNHWKGIKNILLRSSLNANGQVITDFFPWIAKKCAYFYEHFLTVDVDTIKWIKVIPTEGGSITIQDEVGGVVRITTPSTVEKSLKLKTRPHFNVSKNIWYRARWRLLQTTETCYMHALFDDSEQYTIRIWFKRAGGTDYSDCLTSNPAGYTKTSFTWSFDTNWHIAKITASSSEAKFYADGSLKATHTTNIPTMNLKIYHYIHNYELVAKSVELDYTELYQKV